MPAVRSRGLVDYDLGTPRRIEWDYTDARSVDQAEHFYGQLLLDDAADDNVTFFNSDVAVPVDWIGFAVDPEGDKDEDLWVNVEITAGGNVVAFRVSRLMPLILSNGLAGLAGSITNFSGNITLIRARNFNSGTTANRDVYCVCFGTK